MTGLGLVDEALVLDLLAEHGPLRATSAARAPYPATVSWPASADDDDSSPWLALTVVRRLIVRGLVRYVDETDRYALTSAGYRLLSERSDARP